MFNTFGLKQWINAWYWWFTGFKWVVKWPTTGLSLCLLHSKCNFEQNQWFIVWSNKSKYCPTFTFIHWMLGLKSGLKEVVLMRRAWYLIHIWYHKRPTQEPSECQKWMIRGGVSSSWSMWDSEPSHPLEVVDDVCRVSIVKVGHGHSN